MYDLFHDTSLIRCLTECEIQSTSYFIRRQIPESHLPLRLQEQGKNVVTQSYSQHNLAQALKAAQVTYSPPFYCRTQILPRSKRDQGTELV